MRVHFLFQIASKPTTIFHEKISHSSTFSKYHWKNFAFSLAPFFKWDKILNSIMSSIDNCCSPFLRWKNGQNDTHSNFLLTKFLQHKVCVCLFAFQRWFLCLSLQIPENKSKAFCSSNKWPIYLLMMNTRELNSFDSRVVILLPAELIPRGYY